MLQALEYPAALSGELAILAEARAAKKNGDWFKAAALYGQLNKQNPAKSTYRSSQLQCLRRGRFVARREDRNYQQYLEQTSSSEALQVLTEVLSRLQQNYVDARLVAL